MGLRNNLFVLYTMLDISLIDTKPIEIVFDASKKINTQSLTSVYDRKGHLKIKEFCYGFTMLAYDKCPGYWDSTLNYYKGKLNLQFEMIKNFL